MAYMCRVCLSSDLRLRTVQIELMSVYNRLTNVEFCSEDARPRSVCSFCYQKLLKCYTFSKMAQRSEQIFNRLLFGRAREVALRSTTELNLGSSQQFSYSPMMHIEFNDNVMHDSSHVKEEQISVKVEPISVKMEPISVKEEITVEKECLVDEPVVDASLSEEDIKNALIFEDGTEEVELNNARYHEKKETFECDSCGICFNTKIKLICHIKKKHKAVAVKLKKQSSFTSTKVDSDKMVTGISGMVCSVCNRVYNSTAKLKRHMGMHTGERPFTCSVCEMSFCLKSGLKKHKTTHTSEKPYACSTCDQTFGRRSHLIYHLRKHNGAKRYSCTVCSKSYTQSTGLVIHMRLHTGEKPYKCTECDKAFIYSTQLKRHLQLHTGVKIKIKLKKN